MGGEQDWFHDVRRRSPQLHERIEMGADRFHDVRRRSPQLHGRMGGEQDWFHDVRRRSPQLHVRVEIGKDQQCGICLKCDYTFKAGHVLSELERTHMTGCTINKWLKMCNECIDRLKLDYKANFDRSRSGLAFGPGEGITEVNIFF